MLVPVQDVPIGTGYAALELCTRTLQSGEDYERVKERYLAPKVSPLPHVWEIVHNTQRVEVKTALPTLVHTRVAVFREGLGCTLAAPGVSEAELRAQPFVAATPRAPDTRPWPLGEGPAISTQLDDAQRTRLARAVDEIFAELSDAPEEQRNALALLVAQDGQLVFEHYREGYGRERPLLGWSMTKSLTAILVGLLEHDGKLAIDAPVGLLQWQGTPKAAITWRQLLNMAPGLTWFEGYKGFSDATEMLFSQPDQGAWAADRPLGNTPGAEFVYSTGFSNIAMLRMRQLLGGNPQALYDYYQQRLFTPLGIRGGVIEPDASGTPVGGARGVLRPVDWLRLGQLVANGGVWEGTELVGKEFMTFLLAPSPANPVYGGSLWRKDAHLVPAEARTDLPDDTVYFAGVMGQLTMIVPSKRLVVVRMGASLGGEAGRDKARAEVAELVADLVQRTDSAAEALTSAMETPPHRGFWPTLQTVADEAEGYATLTEMAAAADHVVVGRMSNFRLNRVIQTESAENVAHMAAVDIEVEQLVRGVNPGARVVLEFLLPGRPHEIAAKLQQQMASLPQGQMLFFLRQKGGSEAGLYRIVNSMGVWLAEAGSVRAPLSLALFERDDSATGAELKEPYASELATVRNLQELVELVAH